jgi:type IV pilus assembly protein PilB
MRCDLKALLLRQMLVTKEQIDWAVESSRGSRSTWLEQMVLHGLLNEERVSECVAAQACVPRCDLRRLAELPIAVVARLPAEVAVEHRVVPLGLEPDGDLLIGMVNPFDLEAVEEVQFFAGRPVMREVVTPTALAWALHHYHGVRSALWPRAVQPSPGFADADPRI